MADIGKLAVQVSASSKSMAGDMKKAADDLGAGADAMAKLARGKGETIGEAFSKGVRDKWAAVGKFTTAGKSPVAGLFGDAFGGLRGILEEGFTNPIKAANDIVLGSVAGMASKIPVVGGIMAAPFQAMNATIDAGLGIYEANADRIGKLGKGAAKAGLDVGDFQLLSKITGDVDGAAKAWSHFNSKLAEAEMAGEGVHTVFTKFGMDGKKLAADFEGNFEVAMGRTFDRIARLPRSLQALAAREYFGGKIGLEMLPSIRKGSAGVAEQRGMLEQFGGGVTDGLVDSVKQAQKAKKQIEGLWEGFGNQVTMAVAPGLAMISEAVGKLPVGFAGLGETIVDAVGVPAKFVANIIDGWTNGDTADRMKPYWLEFKAFGADAVDFIVDRFVDGMNSKITPTWMKLATAIGLSAAMNAGYSPATPDGKGETEADRWRKEAAELRKRLKPGDALAGVGGFFEEWKKRMKGGKAGEFDPFGKLWDRIEKLNEATRGPLGEFNDKMGDTLGLLRKIEAANPFDALRKGAGGFAAGMGDVRNLFDALAGLDLGRLDKALPKFLGDAGKGLFGLGKEAWLNRDEAGGKGWKDFDPEAGAGGDWGPTRAEIADMKKAWGDIGDGLKNFAGVMTGGALDTFLAGLKGVTPLREGAAELDAYAQYQKLKGALGGDTHKLAGALEQGSAGAYSAIAQFEAQRPENVQVEMKRLMEFAQRQRDEQIRVGREAAEAFRNIKAAKF